MPYFGQCRDLGHDLIGILNNRVNVGEQHQVRESPFQFLDLESVVPEVNDVDGLLKLFNHITDELLHPVVMLFGNGIPKSEPSN
jgi:hypothetical protein